MKFQDYKYTRPDYKEFKNKFVALVKEFDGADSFEDCEKKLEDINSLRNHILTMVVLVQIRHTIDTKDDFYNKEQEYWDENIPLYEEINVLFYKSLMKSKFKNDLEKKHGKQLFKLIELKLKAFSPQIIEDLQIENKVSSEYVKLIASARIPFHGKDRNLSELMKYRQDKDRTIRKAAWDATYKFFEDNMDKFDDIYDRLVKIRTNMARKLGFENFVELGYIRMSRTDYNADMVAKFRQQVKDCIVPLASKLYKMQQERLELDTLRYYDLDIEFNDGNAVPKGDSKWIIDNGKKMYDELSPETSEFFQFMIDHELLDLVTKKGKASGGYCTYIAEYESPFIFSNFNGTSGDVDVLTHEAGHAFQAYLSRWITMFETIGATYESAEIHSMSMEFLTWPWMENFFKEDAKKYKFAHLGSAIKFIPYGVTVDEFQHFVYENPDITPRERRKAWRDIEKKYLPHLNYEGNDFLENGGYWFKQGHIFQDPFYYIDYTLAQICALQFWKMANEDRKKAWTHYLNLCKQGGTKSFLELVKVGNLISPFEEGCVKSIIGDIEKYFDENPMK